jgi:NAD+ synthase|tara:strand:- start:1651 stop:2433 length:783 start_codon:yes stop_codon:yes gene_type:complete
VNQEILSSLKNIDYNSISERIQKTIKQKITQFNSKGVIFGLSGGIDSAVIAYLCANSVKENTTAIIMPDSKISPEDETNDALKIVDSLNLNYKLIDINQIHKEYYKVLEPEDRALGNLRARIRKNILYYYANSKNLSVLGSSDKSEYLIGYFTKFGDGAADVLPIASLYKTQIRELARTLDVPDNIIVKKSSPNLWPNHTAESEIGVSYEEIDTILHCINDKQMTKDETVSKTEIGLTTVDKIYQLYKKSEHKRITAEIL